MNEPHKVSVLLLEDSPQDVFLLRAALARGPARFELFHAERLVEALALLKQHQVDVVLTDLNLPDSEGLHTIRELVGHSNGVPIVVLAGCNNPDVPEQWRQAGAWGHFSKDSLNSPGLPQLLIQAQQRRQ